MAQHNDLGTKGEQMACDYLSRKGYKIIARNWRLNKYEVDIIAQLRNEIIFVEVKTRSTDFFGNPEDAVDYRRQKRMTSAGNAYMKLTNCNLEPRFDVIAIVCDNSCTQIKHIENAFEPLPNYY